MKPLCALTLALIALALTSASAATYTFDNLTTGNVAGQDGWFVLAGSGDSSDIIKAGTGSDTTNVMGNPGPTGPTGVHRMGRTNDGNFSFGSLVGVTSLTLAFDTQVMNNASISQDFINFALADPNLINSTPAFSYKQLGAATPTWAIGGGGGGSAGGSFPTPITTGDWIRMTLVINVATNTSTLSYSDLTTPAGSILLGTATGIGSFVANEALFNTMWSRSDNGPSAVSAVVQDNLTVIPTFAPVPEMNGAWIAAACAVLLGGHFWRRTRRSHV